MIHFLERSWKKETYESSNLIFVVIFQGCKEKHTEEMSCWVKKRMNIHRQRINSFSINRWQLQSTLVLAVRWKVCWKNGKLNSLQNYKTELEKIYTLLSKVDTNLLMFQYKTLDNVLIRNKLLFKFKKVSSLLCSCKSVD